MGHRPGKRALEEETAVRSQAYTECRGQERMFPECAAPTLASRAPGFLSSQKHSEPGSSPLSSCLSFSSQFKSA